MRQRWGRGVYKPGTPRRPAAPGAGEGLRGPDTADTWVLDLGVQTVRLGVWLCNPLRVWYISHPPPTARAQRPRPGLLG